MTTKSNQTMQTLLRLSVAVAGIPSLVHAEELLFSLAPSSEHFELGSAFAAIGDVNGDGVIDVAVADRSGRVGGFFASGIVHLVSGADGSAIRDLTGTPANSQNFGVAMAGLDVDGDGVMDLAVGAPGHSVPGGAYSGAVRIYSGASGSLLASAVGPASSQLGSSLANAGDQDGDGVEDLYAGAPNSNGGRGGVFVLSGADGSVIREIASDAAVSSFGLTLAALGDVDGDGLADVAIGAPGFRVGGNQAGRVVLVRSLDGGIASAVTGSGIFNRLGESLAVARDLNGDGLPDLMAGSYSGGTALVLSGADFSTLVDLTIPGFPAYSEIYVGGSLDFDSDGAVDFLIGSPALLPMGSQRVGGVRIVSGADGSALFEFAASAPFTGLGYSQTVLPGLGFAVGERFLRDPVTKGSGFARVWKVEETPPVLDSDEDGVMDDVDLIPGSIMDKTVVLLGVNSKVSNRVDTQGVTLADRFAALGDLSDVRVPALYLVKVIHLSKQLVKAKLITRVEARNLNLAALKGVLKTASRKRR
jgi:hypothetical protein